MKENVRPICKTDANGDKSWCINGKLHREDGPAIEWANGNKSWYINGKQYPDIQKWAKAVLASHYKLTNDQAVQNFLRPILQKQIKESI